MNLVDAKTVKNPLIADAPANTQSMTSAEDALDDTGTAYERCDCLTCIQDPESACQFNCEETLCVGCAEAIAEAREHGFESNWALGRR